MMTPEKKKSKPYVIVFFAVLIGFTISQCLRGCSSSLPSKVLPYVNEADKRSHDAVDESLEELNAFFEQAKANARPFADDAVGWGSKWRLVADHVPYTKGDRHEIYIREKFNERIFSDEQLTKVVEDTVAKFLQRLESIDNKMLVDIRADLPDLAEGSALQTLNEQLLLETYHETLERIWTLSANKASSEIGADVTSFVVTEIADQVLTQVAIRLGVSSGILGAGAGSSWATFGIGVVVAIIVDYIVAKIWDWYADPKGTLAAEIIRDIDSIQTLLINGAPATDSAEPVIGLRDRLSEYAQQRHKHRKATLRELLKQ